MLLLAALAVSLPLAAAEDGAQRRSFQAGQIAWLNSAAWITPPALTSPSETPVLLVPDLLQARLLTVSPSAAVRALGPAASGIGHPAAIRQEPQSRDLLVEDYTDSSIHRLDASLKSLEIVDFSRAIQPPGKAYDAFRNWVPFGRDILFYGDFLQPGTDRRDLDNWSTGFAVRDQRNRIVRLTENAYPGPSRQFYLESRDHMAAVSQAAFILQWEAAEASLLKVVRDPRNGIKIAQRFEVPADFRAVPYLDDLNNWRSDAMFATTTEYYRRVERSRAVVGVVAWKDRVFLVAKEPMAASGATAWWLIEVSTGNGGELHRWRLPVDAAHLTVVPGETWAFFEKLPVVTYGPHLAPQIDIPSLTTISASSLLASER